MSSWRITSARVAGCGHGRVVRHQRRVFSGIFRLDFRTFAGHFESLNAIMKMLRSKAMSNQLRIVTNGEDIGSITFDEPEETLAGGKTGSGFRLRLPTTVNLEPPKGSPHAILLDNVRVVFQAHGLEFGVARCDRLQTPKMKNTPMLFSWDWTLPMLAVYEAQRAGKVPRFTALLYGDLHYRLEGTDWKEEVLSVPFPFNDNGVIKYSRETWTKTLREMNVLDTIVVEIPFPSNPPSDWDGIFESLREAREAFDKGGSSGWKGCVSAVRHALQQWQKKEQEDHGPGWTAPQKPLRDSRTKRQRMDNIRWHLLQLAHYSVHTNADEWNKDDATLALAVLSALVAVRKP